MRKPPRLLAGVLLLTGCAAEAGHQTPARPSTTAPTAMTESAGSLTWTTISMEDLKPLNRLGGDGAEFAYKLRPAKADHTLYFGELQNGDDQLLPIIALRTGGAYKALAVAPDFSFDQWVSVASGPKPGEVWAILDQVNDAEKEDDDRQTNEVTVFHSTDAGKTFQRAVIRKPCRKASFSDLVLSRAGRGRISLALNEDCGKHKAGVYHYRTTDGGKTFAPVEFEPDATRPADEVPDEEQPNQGNSSASAEREMRTED